MQFLCPTSAMSDTKPRYRPMTTKEARRAYNRRGGMQIISKEERARLKRELEKEEATERQAKQEKTRREARKKREAEAAQARDEYRKLGIPDPKVKVRASQPRMTTFLRGKGQSPDARDAETDEDSTSDSGPEELAADQAPALAAHDATFDESEAPSCGQPLTPEAHLPLIHPGARRQELAAGGEVEAGCNTSQDDHGVSQENETHAKAQAGSPVLAAQDLWSSFFASNSQIEREINAGSQTTQHVGPEPRSAVKAAECPDGHANYDVPSGRVEASPVNTAPSAPPHPPAAEDIRLLLEAIPSQAFRELEGDETTDDLASWVQSIPSQVFKDTEADENAGLVPLPKVPSGPPLRGVRAESVAEVASVLEAMRSDDWNDLDDWVN